MKTVIILIFLLERFAVTNLLSAMLLACSFSSLFSFILFTLFVTQCITYSECV